MIAYIPYFWEKGKLTRGAAINGKDIKWFLGKYGRNLSLLLTEEEEKRAKRRIKKLAK